MNKKIYIALFTIGIFILVQAYLNIFGRVTTGLASLSLNLASQESATIGVLAYKQSVTANSAQNILVEFENFGTTAITERIQVNVTDSSLNVLQSSSDSNNTLSSGQTDDFSVSYTPTTAGTYYIFAAVPYGDNQLATKNASFQVVAQPGSSSQSTSSYGGGGQVSLSSQPSLNLEYQPQIELGPGQTSLVNVAAVNNGNVDLNNLVFVASDSILSLGVSPGQLAQLKANASFTFLISVQVPANAATGIYPIDFVLTSDKITQKGETKAFVSGNAINQQVNQTITNYQNTLSQLSGETDSAKLLGVDVSAVNADLNQANSELAAANKYYMAQDYQNANAHLDKAKASIEQAALDLAKTSRPSIVFVPVPFPRPEIVGSVIATVAFSGYMYERNKEEKSYRKSIRRITQIIKNRGKPVEG